MKSGDPSPRPGDGPGSVSVTVGEDRLQVRLELRPVGQDWLLVITGGRAHVGAVSLAETRGEPVTLARGSHREGPLAQECAAIIATALGTACAVVAGIHQDQATAQEIQAIVAGARQGAERLAAMIKAGADQR